MLRKILTVGGITWCYSALLGLFFAVCASGSISVQGLVETFDSPGVVPMAVFSSTIVAALYTPLVMWAFKTNINIKDLIFCGGVLFFLLLIYIAIVVIANTKLSGAIALCGSILLGFIGLIVIGFIRRHGFPNYKK
ncbi:MAG: hypothetical protein ACHQYP_12985 [Nitrospiria bacterium]